MFQKEKSIEILKILGSMENIKFLLKNMSREFRLKNLDETTNYSLEEIEQNELMKQKKVCKSLIYIEWFLIIASTITRRIPISFIAWYSCRKCEFCNRIKNLCCSCRN